MLEVAGSVRRGWRTCASRRRAAARAGAAGRVAGGRAVRRERADIRVRSGGARGGGGRAFERRVCCPCRERRPLYATAAAWKLYRES